MTDATLNIGPGDVVSGPEPDELVEIHRIAPFGGKKLIEGVGTQSHRVIKRPLSEEEIGDRAWLYVVTFCKSDQPRLRIIQDPIIKLNPEMLYRQIQFLVDEKDWARNGEEVANHFILT